MSSKSFDSIQDGSVAVFTPHTAFKDPLTPAGTPPRESIEVRALVLNRCVVRSAFSGFKYVKSLSDPHEPTN